MYKLIKVKVDATLRESTTPTAFSVPSANHIRTDKLCIKRDFRFTLTFGNQHGMLRLLRFKISLVHGFNVV